MSVSNHLKHLIMDHGTKIYTSQNADGLLHKWIEIKIFDSPRHTTVEKVKTDFLPILLPQYIILHYADVQYFRYYTHDKASGLGNVHMHT